MSDRDNRVKIFKDLVGVNTYYERFTNKKSDLLLHISFNEATFGGKPNDKISFTVKIRAAKFFVVIEDNTLKIDPSSIWAPGTKGENDMEQTDVLSHEMSLRANADVTSGAGLGAEYTRKAETTTKQNRKMSGIKAIYTSADNDKPSWVLKPYVDGDVLEGGAWDDKKKLLKLLDKRTNTKHVLSSVKLIVQCEGKDLKIISPEYLDRSILEFLQTKKKQKIGMEMIRDALIEYKLAESGLSVKEISHKPAIIPLADILVERK